MYGKIGRVVRSASLVLLAWFFITLVWAISWPPTATAVLGNGREINMVLSPLSGSQSDYGRSFIITWGSRRTVVPVFEDTGWWRATPLYQAEDGRFILLDFAFHDVLFCQDGIKVDPPGYTGGVIEGSKHIDACPGMELLTDAPPARYWQEFGKWRYVGVFVEPREGEPFAFLSWRERPEPRPETYDFGG